jgi:hypothetical protein
VSERLAYVGTVIDNLAPRISQRIVVSELITRRTVARLERIWQPKKTNFLPGQFEIEICNGNACSIYGDAELDDKSSTARKFKRRGVGYAALLTNDQIIRRHASSFLVVLGDEWHANCAARECA